jgi:hypothetical protein
MTSKQIYEATAIELSKVQAPALKLYEFNYFFNQAIRQFVNKVYNVYDVNQQTTDDLRVLKATATLKPNIAESTGNRALDYLRGATYFVDMPDDYLHLLNCICLFDVNKNKECWNAGDVMVVGATKLTADSWSSVVDDVYNQPTKKRPYYYVHNQNDIYTYESTDEAAGIKAGDLTERNSMIPTAINPENRNDSNANDKFHTLGYTTYTEAGQEWGTLDGESNFPRTFDVDFDGDGVIGKTVESEDGTTIDYAGERFSSIEKPAGSRHANSSRVKVEIRCGRDKSNIFSLSAVQIDYVKAPQFIRLTQEQLDSDEDISQVMEFPDYVNQEIINELVNLVMRKTNDPSLNAHMQMTQTIARPTGQSAQPAAQA